MIDEHVAGHSDIHRDAFVLASHGIDGVGATERADLLIGPSLAFQNGFETTGNIFLNRQGGEGRVGLAHRLGHGDEVKRSSERCRDDPFEGMFFVIKDDAFDQRGYLRRQVVQVGKCMEGEIVRLGIIVKIGIIGIAVLGEGFGRMVDAVAFEGGHPVAVAGEQENLRGRPVGEPLHHGRRQQFVLGPLADVQQPGLLQGRGRGCGHCVLGRGAALDNSQHNAGYNHKTKRDGNTIHDS